MRNQRQLPGCSEQQACQIQTSRPPPHPKPPKRKRHDSLTRAQLTCPIRLTPRAMRCKSPMAQAQHVDARDWSKPRGSLTPKPRCSAGEISAGLFSMLLWAPFEAAPDLVPGGSRSRTSGWLLSLLKGVEGHRPVGQTGKAKRRIQTWRSPRRSPIIDHLR